MKNHEELRSMLPAMAGGDLSKTELALLEQHLDGCRDCRTELAQLQLVVQAMRETPELEPPPWLATRIMARVQEEAVVQKSWFARLFLPLQIKLPLEALALVMICATTWYVMQDVERSQQRPQILPAAEAPAAAPARDVDKVSEAQAPRATVPLAPPSKAVAPKAESPQSAAPVRPESQRTQAAPAFAPSPQNVPERIEQMERMERIKSASESVPAPPSANREQRAGSPSPMAERKMAAKREVESSYSGSIANSVQPIRLRLVVDDRTTVATNLRIIVQRLGGTILESRTGSAKVRMQADRLPELVEQLARLGRIIERPVVDKSGDNMLELLIIWQASK